MYFVSFFSIMFFFIYFFLVVRRNVNILHVSAQRFFFLSTTNCFKIVLCYFKINLNLVLRKSSVLSCVNNKHAQLRICAVRFVLTVKTEFTTLSICNGLTAAIKTAPRQRSSPIAMLQHVLLIRLCLIQTLRDKV